MKKKRITGKQTIRRKKSAGLLNFLKPSKKTVRKSSKSSPKLKEKLQPDYRLIVIVTLFSIAGVLMIFSASATQAANNPDFNNNSFFFVERQIIWLVLGSLLAYIFYIIPINTLRSLAAPMLAGGIFLLLLIVPEGAFGVDLPFVITRNGASRWLDFGVLDFQPAEFIKFAYVVYLSAWLTRSRNDKNPKAVSRDELQEVVLPFVLLLGFIGMLVLAQKDLDTTVIITLTILTVYYIAGTNSVHTASVVGILIMSFFIGTLAISQEAYRAQRVTSWWEIFIEGEPSAENALDESFQNWNGIIAIGSGGLFGQGYTESRYKLGFLQEAAYTDSIYAVLGEEFGLMGAMLVIIGFLYFASLGFEIAQKAPNKFASLLATGMTSWIVIQAFLNIAANLGVIPFGGMPLPFFSYGGSSTIAIFMAIGILLNVSKQTPNTYG